jgi:hypothetical protein
MCQHLKKINKRTGGFQFSHLINHLSITYQAGGHGLPTIVAIAIAAIAAIVMK